MSRGVWVFVVVCKLLLLLVHYWTTRNAATSPLPLLLGAEAASLDSATLSSPTRVWACPGASDELVSWDVSRSGGSVAAVCGDQDAVAAGHYADLLWRENVAPRFRDGASSALPPRELLQNDTTDACRTASVQQEEATGDMYWASQCAGASSLSVRLNDTGAVQTILQPADAECALVATILFVPPPLQGLVALCADATQRRVGLLAFTARGTTRSALLRFNDGNASLPTCESPYERGGELAYDASINRLVFGCNRLGKSVDSLIDLVLIVFGAVGDTGSSSPSLARVATFVFPNTPLSSARALMAVGGGSAFIMQLTTGYVLRVGLLQGAAESLMLPGRTTEGMLVNCLSNALVDAARGRLYCDAMSNAPDGSAITVVASFDLRAMMEGASSTSVVLAQLSASQASDRGKQLRCNSAKLVQASSSDPSVLLLSCTTWLGTTSAAQAGLFLLPLPSSYPGPAPSGGDGHDSTRLALRVGVGVSVSLVVLIMLLRAEQRFGCARAAARGVKQKCCPRANNDAAQPPSVARSGPPPQRYHGSGASGYAPGSVALASPRAAGAVASAGAASSAAYVSVAPSINVAPLPSPSAPPLSEEESPEGTVLGHGFARPTFARMPVDSAPWQQHQSPLLGESKEQSDGAI